MKKISKYLSAIRKKGMVHYRVIEELELPLIILDSDFGEESITAKVRDSLSGSDIGKIISRVSALKEIGDEFSPFTEVVVEGIVFSCKVKKINVINKIYYLIVVSEE